MEQDWPSTKKVNSGPKGYADITNNHSTPSCGVQIGLQNPAQFKYSPSWPSKCGPLTNNISITWERDKITESQAPFQTKLNQNLHSTRSLGDCTSKYDCSKQSAALSRVGTAGRTRMSSLAQLTSRRLDLVPGGLLKLESCLVLGSPPRHWAPSSERQSSRVPAARQPSAGIRASYLLSNNSSSSSTHLLAPRGSYYLACS